jgi:two-component system response regulator
MSDSKPKAPIHIFLVEDDSNDQALTLRTLASCCPERIVTIFHDGRDVIDHLAGVHDGAASETLPDLILLDIKLPRMSGLEVLQWLRANPATQRLDVMILSSACDDRHILALHRLGILAYLEKPLRSKEFLRAAAGILRGLPSLRA